MVVKHPVKIFLCTLICVMSWSAAPAQDPGYSVFNIQREFSLPQRGLGSQTVRQVTQDAGGLLWIATPSGLDISDGISFTPYQPGTADGVPSPAEVHCVLAAGEMVLAGTDEGIAVIGIHDRQQQVAVTPYPVRSLSVSGNKLVATTAKGLYFFDLRQDSWPAAPSDSLAIKEAMQVLPAGDELYIATYSGLWEFDRKELRKIKAAIPDTIWSLEADDEGMIWCGTSRGLVRYNPSDGSSRHILPSSMGLSAQADQVLCMLSMGKGRIWAGTSGAGVLEIDPDGEMACRQVGGMGSFFIYDLYRTEDGTIWAGSAWNGLFRIEVPDISFRRFDASMGVWDFLYDASANELIVAGDRELLLLDESMIRGRPGDFVRLEASGGIRALLRTSATTILCAGTGSTIYRLDERRELTPAVKLRFPSGDPPEPVIQDLIESSDGKIWAVTNEGLCRFSPDDDKQEWFFHKDDTSSTNFYCASIPGDRTILFGSRDGLYVYDETGGRFSVMRRTPGKSGGLTLNKVISVLATPGGDWWVGTLGGGLNLRGPGEKDFSFLTQADGLPDNVITSLLADQQGHTWIGTNKGLCRYDGESGEIILYAEENGLPGEELNIGASYCDPAGRLWFGGRNGFSVLDTNAALNHFVGPSLCVTALGISGRPTLYGLAHDTSFVLPYWQNSVSIAFCALAFTRPLDNRFRYMLDGYDQEWRECIADRAGAEYRKLVPGEYRFLLYGTDHQGFRTHTPLVLTFRIRAPWWQAWWFRSAIILIPVLLVFWFWRNRLLAMRRRHTFEMQILEAEKQALRLQMNPHFIFNALNSIQGFVLQGKTDEAVNYLAKFSHLMRLILNNSREAFVPLEDELSAIRLYLEIEQLRFRDSFTFDMKTDDRIDPEFTGIPPMLIQPYVENAILHGLVPRGGGGRLEISIGDSDEGLIIVISDNGIGRQASAARRADSGMNHRPKGMLITRERLELLNRQYEAHATVSIDDLMDEQGNPAGTRVTIRTISKEL